MKINENLERFQRQNMASVQLPQPTRSQAGKPEEVEFWPQPHLVSLSDNLSFVQAWHFFIIIIIIIYIYDTFFFFFFFFFF